MSMEREDRTEETRVVDPDEPTPQASTEGSTLPPPPTDTTATGPEDGDDRAPLLEDDRASSFRSRWEEVQVRFVDEPRTAVEQADRLVTEVVEQLQASFTSERGRLEGQWQQGGEVSTEDLRVALQRYRSFFDRLLAA